MTNSHFQKLGLGLALAASTAVARAQTEVLVTADITTSTTWTPANTYNLQQQIYVRNGATLTIEAGTILASTTNLGGSLAVSRGSKIFVKGTEKNPVIMTSKADVLTWAGGNPKTGTWREACNEWGNLTIMGNGYISEDATSGNVPTPNASNVAAMEGLIGSGPNDPNVLYGGGNDDDDSGTISYLSLRYGGRVIGLNNELNGLSLGGIGRETDIHHVEIMNNVDDGVEIWGGTVNLKYFSIWNIGDDSFDIDQGWRGKAQFGLIVQGYSVDASQGSGVGDNCFETDGAEDSSWQPVTTTSIYNFTVIGQPQDGDRLTAWRDNASVQYHNCIFMNGGEELVGFDNVDGDGAHGYGFESTVDWPTHWTTPHTTFSTVNAPANPALFYTAQTSGNWCEITDSVFFSNLNANAYTQATARGVFNTANNNVTATASPIVTINRGPAVVRGGKVMEPVILLNPMPANDAVTSVRFAPYDGFYSSAKYRGAFSPNNNWLCGWTASTAFGFTPASPWCDLGFARAGTNGDSVLAGFGLLGSGSTTTLALSNAFANSPTVLVIGLARGDLPLFGGTLVPSLIGGVLVQINTDPTGSLALSFPFPRGVPSGTSLYFQAVTFDPGVTPTNLQFSNAVCATKP
ncbi:MAG: hypothetical protein R3F56_06985 [Planctomycetota bacterium]